MRVLLVQDDLEPAAAIRNFLKKRYTVDCVDVGEDAIDQAESSTYDVYILDVEFLDDNAIGVCHQLHELGFEIPILILTASNQVQDKVLALDTGADDYLTKPFHFEELHARLRALMRRGKTLQETSIIRAGDVTVNLTEGRAYHNGVLLHLRRKEFLLLEYFVRHAGRITTRNMLLEHVWESKSDPLTNTVDVHIKFLRDKVDRPFATHHIRTIHGIGYKFETEA